MTTALEGGEGSASRPGRSVPPGKTQYLLYRRLGGPQGRSGQVQKISTPTGFDPRTVQPVASRYTDWATRPALEQLECAKFQSLAAVVLKIQDFWDFALCRWRSNSRRFEGLFKIIDYNFTSRRNWIFGSFASQGILRQLWNWHVYNSQLLGSHLSHTNPVHNVPYYLFKIYFNIILPFACTS
jgi:hypothetical protein